MSDLIAIVTWLFRSAPLDWFECTVFSSFSLAMTIGIGRDMAHSRYCQTHIAVNWGNVAQRPTTVYNLNQNHHEPDAKRGENCNRGVPYS
jgi:hypothetical protein